MDKQNIQPNNQYNKKITLDNFRYNNEHRDFYVENSHANYGDKKPQGL